MEQVFVQPDKLPHQPLDPVPFHGALYLPAHHDAEPRDRSVMRAFEQKEMRRPAGPRPFRATEIARVQPFALSQGVVHLYGEPFSPLCASSPYHVPSVLRPHPDQEAVSPFSALVVRLECSFHRSPSMQLWGAAEAHLPVAPLQ